MEKFGFDAVIDDADSSLDVLADNESELSFSSIEQADVVDNIEEPGSSRTGIDNNAVADAIDRFETNETINPRAYQLEMLEESLKQNVIVAMDTGSGKTMTAVLRCQHEIEYGDSSKFIWFLAPTVALCYQQGEVLSKCLPAVLVKTLSGEDKVEFWSSKSIWDAALLNVKVVVSTPAILFDALSHGFVSLSSISLLVFDEAHNYIGRNPGSMIMQKFYRHNMAEGQPIPHILGLSASPVLNSQLKSLSLIESNLDAVCRSPTIHKSELMAHVNIPELLPIWFKETPLHSGDTTPILHTLETVFHKLDVRQDPWILHLQANPTDNTRGALEKVLRTRRTNCMDQLRSLCQTSRHIYSELGAWAVDYFISECITKFLSRPDNFHDIFDDLSAKEWRYIADILQDIDLARRSSLLQGDSAISDKVRTLVSSLPVDGSSKGIVFVKQRATATVLTILLHTLPASQHLRVATIVGSSRNTNRSGLLGKLLEPENQADSLDRFRAGELDVVIATSVLDEGIDIPACNFVLCFDQPENLKTFVQRRGRARQHESKLIMLQPSSSSKLEIWQALEVEMKAMYADKERELQRLEALEASEVMEPRQFRVESTGALLTLDNAVAHLNHFCAVLPNSSSGFVNTNAEYIYDQDYTKVILPLSVDASVRVTTSKFAWQAESNGRKDAAYGAYMKLYRAGLISDHLPPLHHRRDGNDEVSADIEKRASLLHIAQLHNPWAEMARLCELKQNDVPTSGWATATISNDGHKVYSFVVESCRRVPAIPPTQLYWNIDTTLTFQSVSTTKMPKFNGGTSRNDDELAQAYTQSMLSAVYGHRFNVLSSALIVTYHQPTLYGKSSKRRHDEMSDIKAETSGPFCLVHDQMDMRVPYIFDKSLSAKPHYSTIKHLPPDYDDWPSDVSYLAVHGLPKRADFLHPLNSSGELSASSKQYRHVIPASRCKIEPQTFEEVQVALLLPSIEHLMTMHLIALDLSQTILASIPMDSKLLLTAITASSASSVDNYQRLEFLGDTLLKFCTSLNLLAKYPKYHEGYLSRAKDHIVSNGRLARAAVESGLDKYIITKSFTGRRWRPMYLHEAAKICDEPEIRKVSSKVLADVIEALIGAAMISGDIPYALSCMSIFLPEVEYQDLTTCRTAIFDIATPDALLLTPLKPLEKLLGYTFTKPSLLNEAMTHASCNHGTAYERLEYLGDAILDYIVTTKIYNRTPSLTHVQMHHIRTALVNKDYLAFISMEFSTSQESVQVIVNDVAADGPKKTKDVTSLEQQHELPLWKFMRHSNSKLAAVQVVTAQRHALHREAIKEALKTGDHYPWVALAGLQALKVYSDVVESVLGAVYIDSGSLSVVEAVIEKMGILRYLDRVLSEVDTINIMQPKEELGILAVDAKVVYTTSSEKKTCEGREVRFWSCDVCVGDVHIYSVVDGVSRRHIEAKAAMEAVRLIKLEKAPTAESAKQPPTPQADDDVDMTEG